MQKLDRSLVKERRVTPLTKLRTLAIGETGIPGSDSPEAVWLLPCPGQAQPAEPLTRCSQMM